MSGMLGARRNTDRQTAHDLGPTIVAVSAGMKRAVELARRFAATDVPVLLIGETGTGKEVLAQAIHRWSGRAGDLVDVDCGALPPGMVVAELFGHRKGAYTTAVDSVPGLVERAHRGTLFLDELASLPPEGQGALLRVLETGDVRRVGDHAKVRVSVRLVAAMQESRGHVVGHHQLRPELYHRLAGTVITIPPLRHRPEDLFPLARWLANGHQRGLAPSATRLLELHRWPGNVRELRHVIARAVSLTEARELDGEAVAEALDLGGAPLARRPERPQPVLIRERSILLARYRDCEGDTDLMAAVLGVSRATLYRRIQRAGLRIQDMRLAANGEVPSSHFLTGDETNGETA